MKIENEMNQRKTDNKNQHNFFLRRPFFPTYFRCLKKKDIKEEEEEESATLE